MNNFLEKLKNGKDTQQIRCIIKEEIMISESDDEDQEVDVVTVDESSDVIFINVKTSINFNEESKIDKNNILEEKSSNNQATLDSFEINKKHKTRSSSKKFKLSKKNSKNDDCNPSNEADIDTAVKNLTKAYCSECKKKVNVIARKARCAKCKTQLSYICERCDKSHKTYTDLCYHLKNKHVSVVSPLDCIKCGRSFSKLEHLQTHQRVEHLFKLTKHNKSQRQCAKCGKVFSLRRGMLMHKKKCGQKPTYSCNDCPYKAHHKFNLLGHIKEKHSGYRSKCNACEKVFTNVRSMRRHLKVYCGKNKPLECHHCSRRLYRKDQMLVHIERNHPIVFGRLGSRCCKFCGVLLKKYKRMSYHLKRCKLAL